MTDQVPINLFNLKAAKIQIIIIAGSTPTPIFKALCISFPSHRKESVSGNRVSSERKATRPSGFNRE